jgi:phosphoribosyl-ATP pyrophosphohydrolase/phosphoribosyl-AMP cyclohydrolase
MSSLPLKFDAQGLVPAIVQDHLTGQVRMFAYATQTAVRKTLETGLATFWSRSRGELWQKGRVGGHETPVVRVLADCDGDCIIYSSDPHAPSCHSGAPSCFFHALEGERLVQASERPQTLLALLESSLGSRKTPDGPSGSSSPPMGGVAEGLGSKIREEAGELAQALERESDDRVIHEAADTLYHLVAGLRARSISVRSVLVELARRLGAGPV